MVLQIGADPRNVANHGDAELFQMFRRAKPR